MEGDGRAGRLFGGDRGGGHRALLAGDHLGDRLAGAGGGDVLTFFGFMHGEAIGIGQSPVVAVSYLAVACALAACARLSSVTVAVPAPAHEVQLAAAGGE